MTEQREVFHPKIIREDEPRPRPDEVLTEAEQEEGRVEIRLPNGKTITMERDEKELLLCASQTCVAIPATAAEFLAIFEFFSTLADDDGDR